MTSPAPLSSADQAAAQTCAAVADAASMVYTAAGSGPPHAPRLVRDLTASCVRALVEVRAALETAMGTPASAVPSTVAQAAGVGSDVGTATALATAAAGAEDLLAQTATALVTNVADGSLRHLLCQIAAGGAGRLSWWRTAAPLLGPHAPALTGPHLSAVGLPPLADLPEAAGRAGFPDSAQPTDRAVRAG
jgi:hypothetical protein